jgi:ABC-type transporter Mla maintaining outer membrane lipid asymmetry ATPase subunit MlaF
VLYDGRIAAQGTPEEVRRSDDPYVKRFLSLWFEKQ